MKRRRRYPKPKHPTLEQLVAQFGEEYRHLITDRLKWLVEHEADMLEKEVIKTPFNRREYFRELLRRVAK